LLFDVARFKYPPQWCPLDLLYNSLEPMDKSTQMTRGFAIISRGLHYSSFCRMSPDVAAVQDFERWLEQHKSHFKSCNLEVELPHCLHILLVQYMFDLLEQKKLNADYFKEVRSFLPFSEEEISK
jgi:glutathione gamma-glutamylcysteinyltransferase